MSEENQRETSLYDFFYINHEKIGSYLSQLENAGKLTSIKHTSGQNNSDGSDVSLGIKGFVGVIGKDHQQYSEGVEKTFDFSQAIPLSTIEALHINGYINSNIEQANYGQIVLMSGSINICDLGVLSSIWEDMMREHVKNIHIATKVKPKSKELPFEFKIATKILESMPPFISLKTISKDGSYAAWSTLEHRYVVGNPFDFSLKHSRSIRGCWYILGILDAKPYDDIEEDENELDPEDIISGFNTMMQGVRELAGRKHDEYGVTPIAIWRKVE